MWSNKSGSLGLGSLCRSCTWIHNLRFWSTKNNCPKANRPKKKMHSLKIFGARFFCAAYHSAEFTTVWRHVLKRYSFSGLNAFYDDRTIHFKRMVFPRLAVCEFFQGLRFLFAWWFRIVRNCGESRQRFPLYFQVMRPESWVSLRIWLKKSVYYVELHHLQCFSDNLSVVSLETVATTDFERKDL